MRDTDAELEQITTLLASELRVMEEKQAATAALTAQRQESGADDQRRGAGRGADREPDQRLARADLRASRQQRDGAEARLAFLTGELEPARRSPSRNYRSHARHAGRDRARAAPRPSSAPRNCARRAEAQLRESQAALAEIDRELRDAQRSLAEKESKVEVLRHLVESGEGFSEGTQAVLRGLDNPDFFKPAVARRARAIHRGGAGVRARGRGRARRDICRPS